MSMAGKNVMLDCGMHMGYNDEVGGCRTVEPVSKPEGGMLCLTALTVDGLQ